MKKIYLIVLMCISSLFAFEVQKPQIYNEQNITGWLMSEKLDGVRGYWDGKKFYSKNGNPKTMITNKKLQRRGNLCLQS